MSNLDVGCWMWIPGIEVLHKTRGTASKSCIQKLSQKTSRLRQLFDADLDTTKFKTLTLHYQFYGILKVMIMLACTRKRTCLDHVEDPPSVSPVSPHPTSK